MLPGSIYCIVTSLLRVSSKPLVRPLQTGRVYRTDAPYDRPHATCPESPRSPSATGATSLDGTFNIARFPRAS
ncbi:hypothetical protein BJ912DRAFT_995218 [Pholiota molesta]|nr:hypothetical protein BJ912DRAFT_995218 [Pholiota molesta]